MSAPPCFRIPRTIDPSVWRLVLLLILLIFVIVAHLLGMPAEQVTLAVATMTGAVLQLTGAPARRARTR
ncbi:hypothetical protein [Streptosporangium saharense]|uniref:Uncharacterized protein n=1 Tax=Streptosporangium saharense TaxID=1706840 RepID=A0A7W7QU48_9ACTN|nr:hypothetical protein [Streptosporangium saharense]MBB4919792.1 hypothetical protein [Streptosporangium saharense]